MANTVSSLASKLTYPFSLIKRTTPSNNKSQISTSYEDYIHRIGLMKQLNEEQREQVFKDLKLLHVGFWRSLIPCKKYKDPKVLETLIDNNSTIQRIQSVLDLHEGTVSIQTVDSFLEQIENNPEDLKIDRDCAETFVAAFPFLQKLSETPHTVTQQTLETFKQNTKDSIPFLYELYGQKANKYIEANLACLGARDTLPDLSTINQAKRNISNWLNEKPTYRKIARWAKKNQLSDTQFLPLYSFVDAFYGQTSAVVTGLVQKFSMQTVFEQMIALDGVFNGIGFWITKFQILLVGWNKERPDKLRAQYEKELRTLSREKEILENRLKEEKENLAKKIACNLDRTDEITKEFENTVLNPLLSQAEELRAKCEKFQHKLNKLLGIEEMGFLEHMWKKPPQLLNDLKIMVPISIPLTLTYELLYINRYTDYEIDAMSLKFAMLVSYMTFLGAIGNVILKQIIHLTQDRAKLYLEGKKDELLCTRTREFLADFKRAINELKESENPQINSLACNLEEVYNILAKPLIGDAEEQSNTEKTQNREAKLTFSIETTEKIKQRVKELGNYVKSLTRGPERSTSKTFCKYMGLLHKAHDRAAYVPIDSSKFELKALRDYYNKEIKERNLENLLPKNQADFFKDTITSSLAFLEELEKKYTKAELPFEPLLLKVNEDYDKLREILVTGMSLLEYGSPINRALEELKAYATSKENKQAIQRAIKTLRIAYKGLKWDLYILDTKSKEEALKDLKEYKNLRKAYKEETKKLESIPEKLKRYPVQIGMALKQVGKRLAYTEKYNKWISGIPWIPAHSMLNVAGRIGLTSIVQGMILPPSVMLKVWLMFHIPIRTYIFFTEKFMVDLDHSHKKRDELRKKVENGMVPYLEQMVAESKKITS